MSDTQATVVPRGTGSRTGKLAAAAGPMLSMIFVLRKSRDLDRHPDLHGKVVQAFEDFRRHARDGGVPAGDLDDASYALAATLDETMLLANWAGRDQWQADSMARRYCNNEFVGLGFYDKLAQVRRSVPARAETLEIFYYCLVAGFQGKLVESPKELADLTDQLARELASADSTVSPPHTRRWGVSSRSAASLAGGRGDVRRTALLRLVPDLEPARPARGPHRRHLAGLSLLRSR
ncbi:MAG: type IVB secretion system protein IcmH/DotU [Candidatus Eisenbacteria bacterium]